MTEDGDEMFKRGHGRGSQLEQNRTAHMDTSEYEELGGMFRLLLEEQTYAASDVDLQANQYTEVSICPP